MKLDVKSFLSNLFYTQLLVSFLFAGDTPIPWVPEDIFFLSTLMVGAKPYQTVSTEYIILGILRTDLGKPG